MVTDQLSRAVPNEVRDFADRSVEQAKKAFDGFIGVVNAAIASPGLLGAEDFAASASEGSAASAHLSRLAVGFAERNVQGAFELAHNVVHATDLAQVVALQRQFLEAQMKALRSQMRTLGEVPPARRSALGQAAKP